MGASEGDEQVRLPKSAFMREDELVRVHADGSLFWHMKHLPQARLTGRKDGQQGSIGERAGRTARNDAISDCDVGDLGSD